MPLTQDKTSRIFKITGTTVTATTIWTGPIWVTKISWRGPTTANDDLDIVDSLGGIVVDYDAVATGDAGDVDFMDFGNPLPGLIVNTMDSGTLYIHTK